MPEVPVVVICVRGSILTSTLETLKPLGLNQEPAETLLRKTHISACEHMRRMCHTRGAIESLTMGPQGIAIRLHRRKFKIVTSTASASTPPPHRQLTPPCFTAGFTCRFASSPSVLRHHNYIAITATMLHHHATPCSITIIAPSTLSPHHQVPPPCFIVGLTSNFAPSPASLP